MTTINTWLTYAIILNLVQYWYLYVMVNHPWEYYLDMSPHSSCMVLQLTRLNTKLFSYNSYFTPLYGLVCCTSNYSYHLFLLYLSHLSTDFNTTCTTVHPMHALQVQQYSHLSHHLKLITSGSTLHNRVKHSKTHISIIISWLNFKDVCYII